MFFETVCLLIDSSGINNITHHYTSGHKVGLFTRIASIWKTFFQQSHYIPHYKDAQQHSNVHLRTICFKNTFIQCFVWSRPCHFDCFVTIQVVVFKYTNLCQITSNVTLMKEKKKKWWVLSKSSISELDVKPLVFCPFHREMCPLYSIQWDNLEFSAKHNCDLMEWFHWNH